MSLKNNYVNHLTLFNRRVDIVGGHSTLFSIRPIGRDENPIQINVHTIS